MINYLQVEQVSKSFGDRLLFSDISFSIGKGQKTALIAKNGTGKTTLLRIIAGKEQPDSGTLTFRNAITFSYLPQIPNLDNQKTIMEEMFAADTEIVYTIKKYHEALEKGDQEQLRHLTEQMDRLSAWDYDVRIKQVLSQLKINDLHQSIQNLSGGEKKRVALAKTLIQEPDFFILDEPTNHLDLDMIEWLESYLYTSNTTLLIVTHDRYFLDQVCTDILEIDENQIFYYQGNYSYFIQKREERIKAKNEQAEKAENLLRNEREWMQRMPKARGSKAKARKDQYYELEKKAKDTYSQESLDINVETKRIGKKIIELQNISKSIDNIPLIKNFYYSFSKYEKIGIVGKNGTGKSTFLNLLTGYMKPDEGNIDVGETIHFGYYQQSGLSFNENERIIDVVKRIAEVVKLGDGTQLTVSQFLTYFLFPPKMHYQHVSQLSGGEKRRLYLITILMQNPNFLLLDEPTNDLDIFTLNVLEEYLANFQGCVIIVSHDRYFMDKIVEHLFVFEGNGKINDIPGNYTKYRKKVTQRQTNNESEKSTKQKEQKEAKPKSTSAKKLSYKEKLEFQQLDEEIASLEDEKINLEQEISSGALSSEQLQEKSQKLQTIMKQLEDKTDRWLELSEMKH